MLAAHTIPLVGLILLGGVWADRLPRHRVVVVTDLVRFALHAPLAILIITGDVQIWQVIAIEALFGIAEAFFRPAATGADPANGARGRDPGGERADDDVEQRRRVRRPGAGDGCSCSGSAPATAFALDAATFLVSAALLVRMRPRRRERRSRRRPRRRRGRRCDELRDGYAEVRSADLGLGDAARPSASRSSSASPRWFVLGPVVADEHTATSRVYGIVAAVLGAGTIIGSLVASAGARCTRCGWR